MHSRSTRILAAVALATLVSQTSAESLQGVPVEVLARSTVQLPDRAVTYIRIRPPALPARPTPPPLPAATEPSAEELLAELRQAAKPRIQLGLGAALHQGDPVITELSWSTSEGRIFRAFSSVDFTHLSQLTELETETTIYGWFPFIHPAYPGKLPPGIREALAANGAQPHYLFEGTEADATAAESTLHALDYLHAYFELNQAALIAATAQRKVASIEHERLAAIKAAQPKDQKIFFWKNETPPTR